MVKKIELKAEKREMSKSGASQLRQTGFIPAVLYGQGGEAETVKIKKIDFERAFESAGESSLIDLTIDSNESIKTIVKNIQKDAIKGTIIHIDLYKIDMKQELETEMPIHFEGESKAEQALGGTLVKSMETIHVKCLPGDLIEFTVVDISKLETFDDVIRVSDINVGSAIKILSHPEDMIVNVVPPRIVVEEVEEEKVEEKTEVTDAKKTEEEKK